MRFLIQQVSQASIEIITEDKTIMRSIGSGAIIYIGISVEDLNDYEQKIEKFVKKIQIAKLFKGGQGKINSSLIDIRGELLLVSNFTLYSRNKKGSGIDYTHSAPFTQSKQIYNHLINKCKKKNIHLMTGEFGALMNITSTNSGPINHIREY